MQEQVWAFIDFENIGSLKQINLKQYQRIYIFCGAKQNHLPLAQISTLGFTEFVLFKTDATSKNNVDFHICYYLGKLDHAETTNIRFIVISNDKGYDNLIRHIQKNGRKCSRLSSNPPPISPQKSAIEIKIQNIINSILGNGLSKLPRTKQKLKNFIKSRLGKDVADNHVNNIYKRLMKNEAIRNRMLKDTETTN